MKEKGSLPHDCMYCRWWDRLRKRCGKKGACFFEEKAYETDTRVRPTPCDHCPYGVGRTCIGWCTRKLVGKEAVCV